MSTEISDERRLRNALGRFVTGVTIVTVATDTGFLGITANSFASVSLEPPLVLWSPAMRSARFAAFKASDHFAVHVLGAHQQPLSDHFAHSGHDFAELEHAVGPEGVPLFPGCAARFECRHVADYAGGDHMIMIGEVLRFEADDVEPLVFHGGSYARLAGR